MDARFHGFDPELLLTTPQAAQAVNVSCHAVRKWRTRGWVGLDGSRKRLEIVDHDRDGNPRHRLRDIQEAERETNDSGRSHRRIGPPDPHALITIKVRPVDWATLDIAS